MQPHCPQCQEPIKAEQINIQRMVALCEACGSVFDIDNQRQKAKRRKVKRPPALRILAEDPLHLAFRTNFRLDRSESFRSSAIMSGVFSMLTLLMLGLQQEGEVPVFLPLMFLLLASAALYSLATIVYNQTHIRVDAEAIHVARRPLPSLTQARQVNLDGIDSFSAEETVASQREGYDTPRYHVWANFLDDGRRLVCGDLVEEYASYIASQLNQRLLQDDAVSAARLSDHQPGALDEELDRGLEAPAKEISR